MNPFDKFIASLNPQAALRRERARIQMEALRKYEGASRGRRAENWLTASTSADGASAPHLKLLRDRSRDLVRNNPFAAKAVQVIVSNVIGTGIVAQAQASRSRRRSQQATDLWLSWAMDPQACDFEGRHDFYGIQSLALRTIVESGEVLIRRRTSPGQRIPLQLQVMEPDFIDTSRDASMDTGNLIRQGIEYDARGKRVAYYLFPEHPGESHLRATNFASARVPAEEIIHCFRQDRPHASRGIPWAAPVMLTLRDLDDYSSAQILKQKISACFAGFVVDTEAADAGLDGEIFDRLEPGAMELLPPGKDIRFANPPSVGEFDRVTRQYLLQVASGFGITYESLTGDLNETSFSSGRMGWLEFHRNIEQWRWNMLIPGMLNPIWNWFINAGTVNGQRTDGLVAHWTPPRRELIDPAKEISATKDAVRSGFMSLSEAQREFGYDPFEVITEIQADNERLDAAGIILDSDPRKVSSTGQVHQQQEAPADPDD
tara:strand:- start:34214 stop:35677 length:1464 start_codon:yes stop_codon:yes gene_type:complete